MGKGSGPVAAEVAAPKGGSPAWIPIAVFAAATVLLFPEVFFSGGLLLGVDTYALSYFARDFYTSAVHETGRFPLWQPLLFGGMPFVDGMHGDIFYPLSLALFFLDARTMWGWKMVLHVFLAGVFTFLWLRQLGLRRGPAMFGGLVFMMGADLVSLVYPGGDGKLFVSALAPLMFLLTDRAARRGRVGDYAFFALGLAAVMLTSHMQLAFFTVWGVSLYFLFRAGQRYRADRRSRALAGRLAAFGLAGVLGVGAAAAQFLPPLDYLREWSHRAGRTLQAQGESAYEYSTTYSLHAEEVVALVVPEFVGDNVATETRNPDRYWGRNVFKINHEYAGLVPLLLLPLLFIRRRSADAWFFAALAGLALLYALGASTPVFRLFYLIPGVNLFRAPSIIIFLYGLSVATLGALALQRLLDDAAERDGPAAPRAHWIVAAVFLALALAQSGGLVTNLWQSFVTLDGRQVQALNANLDPIRTGFWIAFAFALGVAAVREAVLRAWIGARDAVIALSILAALDLYRIDRPFVRGTVLMGRAQEAATGTVFRPDAMIEFLQQRVAAGEVFRTYDLGLILQGQGPSYGNNVLATHGVEQLTGHHGNEIGRYRQLVGGDDGINVAASNLKLLDLANVSYVISPQRFEIPGYEEAFAGERAVLYRNANALPRARLVGSAEIVADDSAVARLLSPEFDMRNVVLLPEPLPAGVTVEAGPVGTVEWVRRDIDGAVLRVSSDRPALLVVSENYYPAWQATVDGAATEILRANYTFRALPVPAGEHEVRFEYRTAPLRNAVAASAGLLLLLLAVGIGDGLRRRDSTEMA
jgi:hypothetical protein